MKELLKKILRRSGFELRRNNAASNPYYQLKQLSIFMKLILYLMWSKYWTVWP